MKKIDNTKRIEFLAKQFDVYDDSDDESINIIVDELLDDGFDDVKPLNEPNSLALISTKEIKKINNDGEEFIKVKTKVSVSFSVFQDMIDSDPTENKQLVQWMLTTFTRLIKDPKTRFNGVSFIVEDLPLAKEYLTVFELNKNKVRFKTLCLNSYGLRDVVDCSNINQYKTLSKLYDAVDPFIERDSNSMLPLLESLVLKGEGEIPVRDRNFTVFKPKTVEASIIFGKFASWCTSVEGNGMFSSYTNEVKPSGEKSDIYIVINNKFFNGEHVDSECLYQLHFESDQIRNRKQNNVNSDGFVDILMKSESLSGYFKGELLKLAKVSRNINNSNIYLKMLSKLGWSEYIFDGFGDSAPMIKILDLRMTSLPNLSRFSELESLIICNCKLYSLNDTINTLKNIRELILTNNNIDTLPSGIGGLSKLIFINLIGNKIKNIPDDIKMLDSTNGGSLYRVACDISDLGEDNYNKLKRLLPSVNIG